MRVLIVEDDRRLARLITTVLTGEGLVCDAAHDGDEGVDLALRGGYDVAVIDWMLPGRDGLAVCRAIRAARLPLAVLLLTARSQVEDRVIGLNNGADDYLVKPFAVPELVARVRALGRRFSIGGAEPSEQRSGDIVLDLHAHTARRGTVSLELTHKEWLLLDYFMRHPGQVLTRQQILDAVWSHDADVLTTQVDVYIVYLRRKLRQPGLPDPIETVRGFGYRLRAADV